MKDMEIDTIKIVYYQGNPSYFYASKSTLKQLIKSAADNNKGYGRRINYIEGVIIGTGEDIRIDIYDGDATVNILRNYVESIDFEDLED